VSASAVLTSASQPRAERYRGAFGILPPSVTGCQCPWAVGEKNAMSHCLFNDIVNGNPAVKCPSPLFFLPSAPLQHRTPPSPWMHCAGALPPLLCGCCSRRGDAPPRLRRRCVTHRGSRCIPAALRLPKRKGFTSSRHETCTRQHE